VIRGALRVNDEKLLTGDAAKVLEEPSLTLQAEDATELIMVEVRLDG
jgi:redox-sensitive bicupin YhaK (pirin superfamily)